MYKYLCVCVYERERERERMGGEREEKRGVPDKKSFFELFLFYSS